MYLIVNKDMLPLPYLPIPIPSKYSAQTNGHFTLMTNKGFESCESLETHPKAVTWELDSRNILLHVIKPCKHMSFGYLLYVILEEEIMRSWTFVNPTQREICMRLKYACSEVYC